MPQEPLHTYGYAPRAFGFLSRKLAACLLAFLFAVMPVVRVYADDDSTTIVSAPATNTSSPTLTASTTDTSSTDQSSDSVTTPNTDTATTTEDSNTTDTGDIASPTTDATTPDNTAPKAQAAQAQTVDANNTSSDSILSKNTNVKENGADGSLSYNYSLDLPAGRNNMQPDLALDYSSNPGEDGSIVGYRWEFNIPYIERINKDGTNNLYSETYFNSSLSGELVPTSGGSYIPKVDDGSYLAYSLSGSTWTVTDKNGVQYFFGSTATSRQDDPSNSSDVFKYMLDKEIDPNGNYISYTYYKNSGQIYPATITYTNNGSLAGSYEVEFQRTTSTRADDYTSYKTAFAVTSNYLISEVDVLTNGVQTQKYALAYTAGDNGYRSMLASITQSQTNSVGTTTTLPAEQFTYTKSTNSWTEDDTSYTYPATYSYGDTWSQSEYNIGDFNGDSYPDVIAAFDTATMYGFDNYHTEIFNPQSKAWAFDTSLNSPVLFLNDETRNTRNAIYNTGYSIADINGDGYSDILQNESHPQESPNDEIYFNNTGSSWATGTTSWNLTIPFQDGNDPAGSTLASTVDLNGDGLPDVFGTYNTGSQLNTGTAYATLNHGWDGSYYGSTSSELADFNGDGLTDYAYSTNCSYPYVGISALNDGAGNGSSWHTSSGYEIPATDPISCNENGGAPPTFIDLNGDGLVDIAMADSQPGHSGYVTGMDSFLNTGAGWVDSPSWNMAIDPRVYPMDINGDGLVDFIQNDGSADGVLHAYIHDGVLPDYLSTITFPSGGSSTMTYKSSAQYKDGSGNLLNPKLPYLVTTVNTITNNDGLGNTVETTYTYSGGQYYYNTALDRKVTGFQEVTTTDPAGNVTKTYYHQFNGTDSTHGEYSDSIAKLGKPYRIEQYNSSGNLYRVTIYKWDSYSRGSGGTFVFLDQTVKEQYDGSSSHVDSAEAFTYDNTTGNVLTDTNYGVVTGNNDGTFSDTGSDEYVTTITYASNTSANILDLPDDVSTVDQSSNKVKEEKYYYDSQSFGNVNYGNVTKEADWITGSTYANTLKTYNAYGNITQVTDPDSNSTSYSYDSYYLYPTTVTNALSQATAYTYDYGTGKVLEKTDPNSLIWYFTYDGFGRELSATEPDLTTPSTQDTKETYSYTDTSGSVSNTKCEYLTSSSSVCAYSYFDGLNRLIQQKTYSLAGYETVDTAYNNLGLVSETTLPYITSSSSKSSPTTTTSLEITYLYDPLGRVVSTTNNLGTTYDTYSGWTLTVTDPRSKTKVLYKDAYGNLIQVDEHNSSSTYSTYYTYDGNNNLTNITDAAGNVRNFTYDGLGRNLSAQDLHAPTDTYYKTWYYTYDPAGNLTQKIDGNSNTVNYTYDALNRELTENYTGTSGVEVTNSYDSCTDGIGYLCGVTTAAYTLANTYNANGEIASEAKTIGSTVYTTAYTYDRQGNQVTITNPDSSIIKYEYDTGGMVNKVSDKESGAGSYTYIVNSTTYSPTNQPAVITNANGTTTTNTYDATKLYRLTQKVTTAPATGGGTTNIQNIAYMYDANGNITQIVDSSATDASKTVNYTYDDLNRLTQAVASAVASGQSTYTQNYAYNAIGDITSGSAGSYTYAGSTSGTAYANPDAVTAIGSTSLTYDHNGNLLAKGSALSNTWDYNNRLTQSVAGSTTVAYTYDANGQRLTYGNGTTTTSYPSKYYDTDGTTATKHIFVGGMDVASIKGSGNSATIHTDANDQIGGSSVTTNASGVTEEVEDYYPFGTARFDEQTAYNEQRKFAGTEYDADTGLNYMNARYYDGSTVRFVSEDPAFLEVGNSNALKAITQNEQVAYLSNPQNLNSYSYALNDPLTVMDQSGETPSWIINLGDKINNNAVFNYAVDHPIQGGIIAGVGSGLALAGGALAGLTSYAGLGIGTGTAITAGTTGAAVCAAECGNLANESELDAEAAIGSSEINITQDRLIHVLDNHSVNGITNTGKSIFNENEDIVGLIQNANQTTGKLQPNGNYQSIIDIGRQIGTDLQGNQTSKLTVITNPLGNLVTAHPGLPTIIVK